MYIPLASDTDNQYPFDWYQELIHYLSRRKLPPLYKSNTVMNLQQALNMLELDAAILSQLQIFSHIHTRQTNASPQTHGGRVDFSFPLESIPVIFSDVDTRSLLHFTVVEPGVGDATFSITIWPIFQLLLQQTPRIIGTEKDLNRHAASQEWLGHLLFQFRGNVGIRLPFFTLVFCVMILKTL